MAKFRVVNTRFWDDDYTSNLDPIEKLLFLYFLTNPATDICGIYELPLKSVAVDTGIEKEQVEKIMDRFSKDGKIFYVSGWVVVKNFTKHQTINPKVERGIEIGLSKVPVEVMDSLGIKPPYSIDSLSHLNPNLNSNSNPNSNLASQSVAELTTNDLIALFEEVNPSFERLFAHKTQRAAIERMSKKYGADKIAATIKALPGIIKKPYAPLITTPIQLESKLGQLINFHLRQKNNQVTILGL